MYNLVIFVNFKMWHCSCWGKGRLEICSRVFLEHLLRESTVGIPHTRPINSRTQSIPNLPLSYTHTWTGAPYLLLRDLQCDECICFRMDFCSPSHVAVAKRTPYLKAMITYELSTQYLCCHRGSNFYAKKNATLPSILIINRLQFILQCSLFVPLSIITIFGGMNNLFCFKNFCYYMFSLVRFLVYVCDLHWKRIWSDTYCLFRH